MTNWPLYSTGKISSTCAILVSNNAFRKWQHPSVPRSFMGQLGWSICHALWPKSKPIVHPTLYPTHVSFIPSQSIFPFQRTWFGENWPSGYWVTVSVKYGPDERPDGRTARRTNGRTAFHSPPFFPSERAGKNAAGQELIKHEVPPLPSLFPIHLAHGFTWCRFEFAELSFPV